MDRNPHHLDPRRHWLPPVAAIAALTLVEIVALLCRIDGQVLSLVVLAISGLGGYFLAQALRRP